MAKDDKTDLSLPFLHLFCILLPAPEKVVLWIASAQCGAVLFFMQKEPNMQK